MTSAMGSLIRTQLLASLSLNSFVVRGKRGKTWLATIGLAVCLSPTYVGYVVMLHKGFGYLRANGLPLESMLLVGIYAVSQFMILFAGIPTVYATLFQAQDLPILLPLPYKPWQIMSAKLCAIYVPELLVGWAFFLPAFVLYHVHGSAGLLHAIACIPGLLLLPVIPLAISAIASVLILNIPGLGRSKWFWYLGITLAMLAASLSLTMGMMATDNASVADLVQVRARQMAQLGRLLPGTQIAARAMVETGWASGMYHLAHLGVAAAYGIVVIVLGATLYIGPLLRGTGHIRRRRAREAVGRTSGFAASYMRKEWAGVMKEPAVAMNGLGGYIALPLLAVTYTLMKVQSRGKVDILGEMDKLIHSSQFARNLPYFVIAIGLGLAMFGGLSSLFSASYSKDGKRLWLEKTLPVPPFTIYLCKLGFGLALVSIFNAITIGLAALVIPVGPAHWLYIVFLSELVLAWSGAMGLAIDCMRPKLIWKDAVQAVKQNVNVVLGLFTSMAGIGMAGGVLWWCHRAGTSDVVVYTAVLALNAGLLALSLLVGRAASGRLLRVQL